jgi:hypothetical protein
VIVAYRLKNRAVFLLGFAKNEKENISHNELEFLRELAKNWLVADSAKIQRETDIGNLREIEYGEEA